MTARRSSLVDRYAPEHRDPALQTPGVLPTPLFRFLIAFTADTPKYHERVTEIRANGKPLGRMARAAARRSHGIERKVNACSVCGGAHNRNNPKCPKRSAG